jgi:RNA recognition motif-containing protein
MSDPPRERSRSPEPGGGDDNNHHAASDPQGGGDDGGDAVDGIKLYVGNLDYATDEAKLRSEFGAFGTVTDVFLPVERGTQRPRGFGFVTMKHRSDAENAISKLDQSQLDGRTIRVNESRPKGSGGGGGRSGFNAAGKEDVRERRFMDCRIACLTTH